jgi:hypothetical protein
MASVHAKDLAETGSKDKRSETIHQAHVKNNTAMAPAAIPLRDTIRFFKNRIVAAPNPVRPAMPIAAPKSKILTAPAKPAIE